MLYPLKISFRDFVKLGKFDFIKIGQTKDEIESHNFPPENWLSNKTKENSPIWAYDLFQLVFDESNTLIRLNTNYVSDSRLQEGKQIIVEDWWIIPPGKKVSLLDTLTELNSMNVDYEKKYKAPGFIDIQLPNGVYMSFDNPVNDQDIDHNIWTMSVIGIRI